jgi:hypothetical protein
MCGEAVAIGIEEGTDDNFTNIIGLVPVFVKHIHVLYNGSNLGPPGMAIFMALAVKKALLSNR